MTVQVERDILTPFYEGIREVMAKRQAQYRAERYLTIDEFAELLGVTPRTLYRIMRGEVVARPTTMRRIAEKLEVHPSDIEEFVSKQE